MGRVGAQLGWRGGGEGGDGVHQVEAQEGEGCAGSEGVRLGYTHWKQSEENKKSRMTSRIQRILTAAVTGQDTWPQPR